ncbi:pyridine nucleotide-disulfide oxidoreductase [Paractinoplanes abujensis]|uniref:3-phenylpropionate/trans-cinnamate dioxygenase ferredoxin reductase subunit n=1 Tax=Paractinoplanes abujensis TaxID=882441 RepID=A0A7W7CVK5_9ACTN|nr:FAD-dependent oxidoreductase [Actinoplanes abujensis]MBB4695489.1 3-phenylpropionate/trans-cinnamate dioxygenase ferredoxin reductase subunit [Actinoplanes abujensis]GID23073.1 pyridine nucleotide-disulfide oxidoreductase [Actinoplanes abujensis]
MTYVVVGGGLAAAKAVETLRDEGFTGPITLIGAETDRPYERPPLSKGLLLGTDEPGGVFVHSVDWYGEKAVDLRLGTTVTAIDRAAEVVRLAEGDEIPYGKLLLATGASPRPLAVPGGERALLLRTLEDSLRISAAITSATRVVVVGAGWIGLEVAAAARSRGAQVTVVGSGALPLQKVLGDEMAQVFADLHRAHGTELVLGTRVIEVTPAEVVLADGRRLPADVVIAGVGVNPNVALADHAGLAVDDGVLVSSSLATSDPDIFAAGDIAHVDHAFLGRRVRVEHWDVAIHTGQAAARAMLGQPVAYDRLPYFFTDQYDLGMEYTGFAPPGAEVVVRGDLGAREFIAFWLVDGRVAAGMNVNIWDVADRIGELIHSRAVVDRKRLADPGVELADLAA